MIFTILKIIGIILLIILLLIILILGIILLVPIRYRFSGEYFEQPDVMANVRFNPVGLRADASFNDEGLRYTVRLLGGVVLTNTGAKLSWLGRKISPDGNEKETEADSSLNHHNSGNNDITSMNYNDNNSDIDYVDYSGGEQKEHKDFSDIKGDDKDSSYDDRTTDKKDNNKNIENKKKTKEKDNKKKQSLSELFEEKKSMIISKYHDISDKVKKLLDKKDKLIKVYNSKRFQTAKSDVIQYIKALLWAVKPKHVEGKVHFGMDDPATTGEILGGLAVVLPIYEPFLQIVPDFEKQCIEAVLKGYGSIRLISIVKIGLKVILNKNLIQVTKKVQAILEA